MLLQTQVTAANRSLEAKAPGDEGTFLHVASFQAGTGQACALGQSGTDLAGDVVSIEVEATDMLVDPGEGIELLDGPFCCL